MPNQTNSDALRRGSPSEVLPTVREGIKAAALKVGASCSGHSLKFDDILLLKTAEVCRILGNVHPRTLKRLEERGLIRPVSGLIRHKLYARRDVEALVAGLSDWKP